MTPENLPLRSQPAVRGYTILCLTALMAMVLALMENEREMLAILLLAALGALAVIAHWRSGPTLLLVGLVVLETTHAFNRAWQGYYLRTPGSDDSPFMDAVLAAAVLVYCAGLYRLLALVHSIFPVDSRRPPSSPVAGNRRPAHDGRRRRSAGLPGPWEIPALALTAAAWAVAVSLAWLVLSMQAPPLGGVTPGAWRGMLLIFGTGLTAAVLSGATAYLDWSAATPREHLLFLQDLAWRETRSEQNRINRFVVWARLRGQRREEKS